MDLERLSSLVYVEFNSRIINKNKKLKDKCDPLLANDARMAQEWIVEDKDNESEGSTNTCDETIRELDEDDFNLEEDRKLMKILCLLRIVGDILKVWIVPLIF